MGRVSGRVAIVAAGALLLLSLFAPSSVAYHDGRFPVLQHDLYFSSHAAEPDWMHGSDPVLIMTYAEPVAGNEIFLPVLNTLGFGMDSAHWTSDVAWDVTHEVVGDTVVRLSLAPVSVQALATFTVTFSNLGPDGVESALAVTTKTFTLPVITPAVEEFRLTTDGAITPRGHGLRVTVEADEMDVLTNVQLGGSNPSGVSFFARILDSDGDGIPDDHDLCPFDPDCNNDGVIDGDEDRGDGTTYYQHYYQYYFGTDPPPGHGGSSGGAGGGGAGGGGAPGGGNGGGGADGPGSAGGPGGSADAPRSGAALASQPILAGALFAGAGGLTLLGLLRRT